jgi:transposase
MAKTLSEDLRSRLIAAVEGGMSRRAAADRFGVAAASAIRWVRDWRATGAIRAKTKGGDLRSHRIEAYRDLILAAIEAQVDINLVELSDMLRERHGASFAPSTVWRFLDRHAMTIKKTAHAGEQGRPDVAARRQAWFDAQPDLDPEHLVFIDGSRHCLERRLDQNGPPAGSGEARAALPVAHPARALEDHHLHRSAAAGRHDRADGTRRADDRGRLHRLCRTGAGAELAAQQRRHHG